MTRGEPNVDPIQREFFTTEALEGPADAIVRETIQNSLDAGEEGRKVLVRFFLSGEDGALPYGRAERFFQGLWPHLRSEANGLAAIPAETGKRLYRPGRVSSCLQEDRPGNFCR